MTARIPPMLPQFKIPDVTSKKPENNALARGLLSENNPHPSNISKTPQAITINEHILKQLSAADEIDSIITTLLLFLWRIGWFSVGFLSSEKIERAKAMTSDDKNCAISIIKPVLIFPKTLIPTKLIKNGGPALTQKQSVFAAVLRPIQLSQTRSFIHFAAAGYPPKSAASKAPAQHRGNFSNFVIGFKIVAKKSAALLLHIKIEIAINGKTDGITEYEQMESPRRIPSPTALLSKRSVAQSANAQKAVKKFFFLKLSTLFVNR